MDLFHKGSFDVIEYIYRGFKISYKIEPTTAGTNTYTATGHAVYLLSAPKSFSPKKFHTEYVTFAGTEHEIRKLLENYIDFELKKFYEMKKEGIGYCVVT